MSQLIECWQLFQGFARYIIIVEFFEGGVHAVVHIAHEDADIARLVALEPGQLALDVLEAQLVDQLARHLVSQLLIILSMPQMRRNYVKVAVL